MIRVTNRDNTCVVQSIIYDSFLLIPMTDLSLLRVVLEDSSSYIISDLLRLVMKLLKFFKTLFQSLERKGMRDHIGFVNC